VDLWIEGAWRKATPAFNIELCERFGLLPLDFDGIGDSIYHPFDRNGNRHMEYVAMRGTFDEMPLDRIVADFKRFYSGLYDDTVASIARADFMTDVQRETE
jgi:hypothetical protein